MSTRLHTRRSGATSANSTPLPSSRSPERKGAFKWVPPGGYHTDPNYKTFSPRLGLAYQLNSKTVIRTGAAILNAANNGLNAAATDFGSGTFVSNFVSLGPPNPIPFTPPVGGSWSNPFAAGFTYPEKGTTTFAGQNIRVDFPGPPARLYRELELSASSAR